MCCRLCTLRAGFLLIFRPAPSKHRYKHATPRNSLCGCVRDSFDKWHATFAKYNKHFTLPIVSLPEQLSGRKVAEIMAYDSAGVTASVGPDQNGVRSITLTAQKAAKVPVTGLGPPTATSPVAYTTENYGGQSIS
jgi:hypothetical protein